MTAVGLDRGIRVPFLRPQDHAYALPAFVLLAILVVLTAILVPSQFGAGAATGLAVAAPLVLATMALTAPAISGRGGIDLSVGPAMSLVNVVIVAVLVGNGVTSPFVIVPAALGLGALIGLLNGLLIAVVRLQPIIATLGTYLVLGGLAAYILPLPGGEVPAWLGALAGSTGPIPTALLVLVIAFAIWTLIARSTFFRHLRLVGGDERAAFANGVRLRVLQTGAYVIGGTFAGAAGLMLTAVIGSGDASQGVKYTLTSIAALALGGVSLAGGRGGVAGPVAAALSIYLIERVIGSFNFGVVGTYVDQMTYGFILVGALLLTAVTIRAAGRRRQKGR